MRIATIDVGTNTALLLVADVAAGQLVPLYEAERFVRLGEGVDATRRVGQAALARLGEALRAYRHEAARLGATVVAVAGTSASRDAANRGALAALVRAEVGCDYEILSGDDEATWSFRGALSAFPRLDGPCALVDIGGGSTEVMVGRPGAASAEAAFTYRRSLDVGSVRLRERFFGVLPPPAEAVAAAEAWLDAAFAQAALPAAGDVPLVGAAGTLVSLALVHAGVSRWADLPPGADMLGAEVVAAWRGRLLGLSAGAVQALNPAVLTGRADVFAGGVLILDRLMRRQGWAAVRVSPRGLRHGLALRRLDA